MYDEEFYEMDDTYYEYLEYLNEDMEMEERIQEHITENEKLMEYVHYLDSENMGEENV